MSLIPVVVQPKSMSCGFSFLDGSACMTPIASAQEPCPRCRNIFSVCVTSWHDAELVKPAGAVRGHRPTVFDPAHLVGEIRSRLPWIGILRTLEKGSAAIVQTYAGFGGIAHDIGFCLLAHPGEGKPITLHPAIYSDVRAPILR